MICGEGVTDEDNPGNGVIAIVRTKEGTQEPQLPKRRRAERNTSPPLGMKASMCGWCHACGTAMLLTGPLW
eukprot:3823791-Prorocentrum_lima.AAC.1